jgi:hypothetical protein
VKYFFKFLMIMTRKGSLMPRVLFASAGQVMKLVDTLVPMISSTELWMSGSVMRLMCPLRTHLSQIWSGLELRGVRRGYLPYGVEDRQETGLESIFKHLYSSNILYM